MWRLCYEITHMWSYAYVVRGHYPWLACEAVCQLEVKEKESMKVYC